jgi:hypothetical protein
MVVAKNSRAQTAQRRFDLVGVELMPWFLQVHHVPAGDPAHPDRAHVDAVARSFCPKTLEGTMVGKLMAAAAPIFRKFLRVSFIDPPL